MIDFKDIYAGHSQSQTVKYKQSNKDIYDLIEQMQSDGLRVNNIDTSGEVIRCGVDATSGVSRPDKAGETSGWYSYHETDGHFICVYGNWRTNQQWKFYSNSLETLSVQDQAELNKKIELNLQKSKEERKKRHDETAREVQNRFNNARECAEHEYLTKKGLKNVYGLKQINKSLLVPVYSTRNTNKELRSLQYITTKNKRFVSASEVKSGIYTAGLGWDDWSNIKTIAVTEGLATCLSVHQSTGLPTICVFSANFGQSALENIRKFCNAEFLICFDHDESGIGEQRSKEICASLSNARSRIPSKLGDYNDMFQELGPSAVKSEILNQGFKLQQYSIKNFREDPPPREWLVEKTMELSKISLLASVGGIGKSGLTLQLCLDVNKGNGKYLGNKIMQQGNCCILSAEDDSDEIARRLSLIQPDRDYLKCEYDTYVMSIANLGKPLIFVKEDAKNGLHITEDAEELRQSLSEIPDLKLLVIDPIQSFVSGDLNTSQTAQMYAQFCASLSNQFGISVLSIHHLNKSAISEGNTNSVLNARSSIRGSTALTDSHRAVTVMYLDSEENTEKICFEEGIEYNRMAVVKSALVKSNSEADTNIKTLIRRGFKLELLEDEKGKGTLNSIEWE